MSKQSFIDILQHGLTAVGGWVLAQGWLLESEVTTLIGAVIAAAGVVWSVVERRGGKGGK